MELLYAFLSKIKKKLRECEQYTYIHAHIYIKTGGLRTLQKMCMKLAKPQMDVIIRGNPFFQVLHIFLFWTLFYCHLSSVLLCSN